MRSIENETRLTMNKRRNFVNYATMTLSDGTVLNLTPSDFRISGQSFTDDWSDGEAFQVGTAIGKTATLLLDNTDGRTEEIGSSTVVYPHGKFSDYDFYMAYFVLYVCLPDAYTYGSSIRDQMIRIGTFTVTTPVANSATIEITGVDNMYMFDKSFDGVNLDFSVSTGWTLKEILNATCEYCGVAIGYTTFDNETIRIYEKPENITCRQAVSYIAQIAGCNAVISETGALVLKWYNTSAFVSWLDGGTFDTDTTPYSDGDIADGGSFNPWNTGYVADGGDFSTPLPFHNLKQIKVTQVSTDDIQFTGVNIKNGEVEVHYPSATGWDTYALEINDNPFVKDNESTIALFLYNRLKNLIIRPFSCSSLQDPTIEAGDAALVYDTKGNTYFTVITNAKFTTGSYTEVSCKAESPIKQNSRYANSQGVIQLERRTDDYNKQVAHFNELASDALGYYQTTEVDSQTGATTTYIHDQPSLETSTYIWKITADGIFISEDGGQSYSTGVDTSTGTMLMNLIYAHGLTSDWIRTGTLDVGGVNNEDGVIHVTNKDTIQTKSVTDTETTVWIIVGPSQLPVTASYKLFYSISNVETGKNEVIKCEIQKREWDGSAYNYHVVVDWYNITEHTGEFPIKFDVDADNGDVYYAIGFSKVSTTNASFDVTVSANKINTVVDKDGITTSNIHITGGEISGASKIAGLSVEDGEHGLSFYGYMNVGGTNVDTYFKTCARGFTCGRLMTGDPTDYWTRMDYVPDYAMLKVDYGRNDGARGIFVTNAGNNSYSDAGSTHANMRHDGVHVTSDERSKYDIKDMKDALAEKLILKSRPVTFKYNDTTEIHYGFIAQDILKLVPKNNSVVNYEDFCDRYTLNYQELISPLIKVVQNQQAEIDALKQRIDQLESIVNTK